MKNMKRLGLNSSGTKIEAVVLNAQGHGANCVALSEVGRVFMQRLG